MEVVGVADVLPGDPATSTFLVAPIGAMQAVYPGVRLDPTSYLVRRGRRPRRPARAAAIAPYGDLVHLRSRDAVYRALHETPLIAIVEAGMGLALVIGVGYAGLALLAGLTIALAIRRRDLHVLRTLGLSRGGISSTIVIEQVPLLLVALIGGGLVGVGLALAIGPSVGLGRLHRRPADHPDGRRPPGHPVRGHPADGRRHRRGRAQRLAPAPLRPGPRRALQRGMIEP